MSRSARLRAPEALRRPTLALATTAAALAVSPAIALADTALQGEAMTLSSSGAGAVISDSTAAGGKALRISSNGSASKSVAVAEKSATLTVRARGQQCSGAPQMSVYVDGVRRISTSVANTSYADFSADLALSAGTHTIKASFTNDYRSSSCDRNLILDAITLKSPTTISAPTPTATPAPTTTAPTATTSSTAPTGLKATVVDGVVTLDWDDFPSDKISYYAVRRSTQPDPSAGTWTRLATNWTSSTATDKPGTGTFYYYVTAVDTSKVVSPRSSVYGPVAVGSTATTTPTPTATPVPTATPAPSPTATPTPAPTLGGTTAPAGTVVFDGDFDGGSTGYEKFPDRIHPERIKRVDDPNGVIDPATGAVRKVLQFKVYEGDIGPTENPRAQLQTAKFWGKGTTYFIGHSIMFASNYPMLNSDAFVSTGGTGPWGEPYAGSGPVGFRVGGGAGTMRIGLNSSNSTNWPAGSRPNPPWTGPTVQQLKGKWIDRVTEYRTGSATNDMKGYIRIWENMGAGWKPMVFYAGTSRETTKLAISNPDSSNKDMTLGRVSISNYYKRACYGSDCSLTMFHGHFKIGTTLDSVLPRSYNHAAPVA